VRSLCLIIFLLFAGCRSVIPARELRPDSSPDIARLVLKKGDSVIVFNSNFGWYNKRAGLIEGMTPDSLRVEYLLTEINKVETVRNYSVIAAVYTGIAVIGAAIYVIAKLFTLL
jgi:hypothetical protein